MLKTAGGAGSTRSDAECSRPRSVSPRSGSPRVFWKYHDITATPGLRGTRCSDCSGENPAGVKDLSAIRSQLDELRKEVNPDTFAKDDPRRPEAAKRADWKGIINLTQEILGSATKDYLIATRMTEALVKEHGFAGLTAGLCLLRLLTEQCWDRMHPKITEEDDIDTRARRFDWLDDLDKGAWFPSTLRWFP